MAMLLGMRPRNGGRIAKLCWLQLQIMAMLLCMRPRSCGRIAKLCWLQLQIMAMLLCMRPRSCGGIAKLCWLLEQLQADLDMHELAAVANVGDAVGSSGRIAKTSCEAGS